MRYPISHNAGKPLSNFFYNILTFHLPPDPDVRILDPTCGKRYLWEHFQRRSLLTGKRLIENYGEVVFSDVRDLGQPLVSDFRDLGHILKERKIARYFDGIIFDPPYFFGYEGSDDPRKEDYGGYCQSYDELYGLMTDANHYFSQWFLKPKGKLILKCSDQYQTEKREFYPHHITWEKVFSNFKLIDFFIHVHHRMSPTAFQVKDRPCSVIMHTYFMVFEVS